MFISSTYNDLNSRTAGYMPVFGQDIKISAKNSDTKNDSQKINSLDDRTAGISKANSSSKDDFSFLDFLDIINPLQHIPVVSSAYRAITGDEIKPASRAMGGLLFGGPIGLASGIVNGIVADATGKDIPDNIVAMLENDDNHNELQEEQTLQFAAQYKESGKEAQTFSQAVITEASTAVLNQQESL